MNIFKKDSNNTNFLNTLIAKNTKNTPIKSETGFLILDEHGVASVDYSNPEARRKLKEQIDYFAGRKFN